GAAYAGLFAAATGGRIALTGMLPGNNQVGYCLIRHIYIIAYRNAAGFLTRVEAFPGGPRVRAQGLALLGWQRAERGLTARTARGGRAPRCCAPGSARPRAAF